MSGPARLNLESLACLPDGVEPPPYNRAALAPGVIHIGSGAFHRAHQAPVFDDLAAAGDLAWGAIDIGLRSGAGARRLASQDGLFVLEVRGETARPRVIGSILRGLVAREHESACLAAFTDPRMKLVTLTITENGYADPATVGFIARGLDARRTAGLPGLSLLSCDNLPHNGLRLRRALMESQTSAGDQALGDWIESACAFPSSVVDRITPAATEADRTSLADRFGLIDQAFTVTESCSQWIIEDAFAGPKPDFASVGVLLVADVAPFALAKLRLLNAAHSALAWLGLATGFEFVHEVTATPQARTFLERLWDEAAATLQPATGLDLPSYRASLMRRFNNAALPHRLAQIAQDSAAKLGPRLLDPLEERLARGFPSPAIALAVAAYCLWSGVPDLPLSQRAHDGLAAAVDELRSVGPMAAMAG